MPAVACVNVKSIWPCTLKYDRHKSVELDIQCDRYFYKIWLCVCVWPPPPPCSWVNMCANRCVPLGEKIRGVLSIMPRHLEWCTANLCAIAHLSLRPECLVGWEPQDRWAACYWLLIDFAGLLALVPNLTSHNQLQPVTATHENRGMGMGCLQTQHQSLSARFYLITL